MTMNDKPKEFSNNYFQIMNNFRYKFPIKFNLFTMTTKPKDEHYFQIIQFSHKFPIKFNLFTMTTKQLNVIYLL